MDPSILKTQTEVTNLGSTTYPTKLRYQESAYVRPATYIQHSNNKSAVPTSGPVTNIVKHNIVSVQ